MREAWDDGERPIPSNALGMKINEGAMQFLPEDLKTAIERMRLIGSDTQHYEVKAAGQGLPESLAETVSAFANRDGGTIILGLDEKNRFAPVVGFDAKSVADALLRLGNDLTPPCRLEIERYPFEGSEIVVGAVGPVALDQRPCFITRKGVWTGSYIRTGDGDKRLTNYEIDRMREFHRQPAFDREPVYEASLSDLDHSVLEAIVKRNRQITPRVFGKMESHEILEKLGAVTRDEKSPDRYVPTLAGLLVAGKFPQEFFPRLNITFSVYSGITKAQAQRDSWRYVVSGRVNVNRFGHLKVNIRTCKSEQKSEHFSCVRTARSVAIKGRRPSALRAFTPPLAAVEARGAGEPGPFELRLCGPFPCRKVVAA